MDGFNVVSSYTREQAIDDGVLIDITELAKEAGFKIPVAVTNSLYEGYLKPTKAEEEFGQSLNGRIWDLLIVLYYSAKGNKDNNTLQLEVSILFENGRKDVGFKSIIGLGNTAEPVLTIMLPHED